MSDFEILRSSESRKLHLQIFIVAEYNFRLVQKFDAEFI
jgi:hypothetical protein